MAGKFRSIRYMFGFSLAALFDFFAPSFFASFVLNSSMVIAWNVSSSPGATAGVEDEAAASFFFFGGFFLAMEFFSITTAPSSYGDGLG